MRVPRRLFVAFRNSRRLSKMDGTTAISAISNKKAKKARQRLAKGGGTAEDALAIYGANALAAFELLQDEPAKKAYSSQYSSCPSPRETKPPLRVSDVQNLVLWALTNELGEMPKWMSVRNKPLIRGAVVMVAPTLCGLDALKTSNFTLPYAVQLPRAHHSRAASTVVNELFQVKLARKRKAAALKAESGNATEAAAESRAIEGSGTEALHPGRHPSGGWRISYVRTFAARPVELRDNDYPICDDSRLSTTYASAAATGRPLEASARVPLVAIDCEMVLVRGDSMQDGGWPLVKQLARVAVVSEAGETLMDELVAPEKPVVDYLTCYSGMTEELLRTASVTFEEARARVRGLIRDCAVVGHSLESDLHALRLSVPRQGPPFILDTALLFPLRSNRHGPPAKAALRTLTALHLKREIQQPQDIASMSTRHGHLPVEDAIAALDLAALKLSRGAAYGVPNAAWGVGFEPLSEALERSGWHTMALRGGVEHAVEVLAGIRATTLERIPCPNDEAAVHTAVKVLSAEGPTKGFALLELSGGESATEATRLQQLTEALPPNTMVLVLGLGGVPAVGVAVRRLVMEATRSRSQRLSMQPMQPRIRARIHSIRPTKRATSRPWDG